MFNDLPQYIERTTGNMFADDNQIDTCSEDIDTIVQNLNYDLGNVSTWMPVNLQTSGS